MISSRSGCSESQPSPCRRLRSWPLSGHFAPKLRLSLWRVSVNFAPQLATRTRAKLRASGFPAAQKRPESAPRSDLVSVPDSVEPMTEDQAGLLRTGVKQALRTSERNSIQTGSERESGRTTIYDENQSGSTALVSDFRGHQAVVEDFFQAIKQNRAPPVMDSKGAAALPLSKPSTEPQRLPTASPPSDEEISQPFARLPWI